MPPEPQPIGDFVSIPGYVPSKIPQTREEREAELELAREQFIKAARARDAVARYETNCPREYREYDINHPVAQANLESVQKVLNWKFQKKGLLCTGVTAQNKTRSIWALIRKLAYEDGLEVRHFHASDWLSSLHECVKYGRDEAKGWISDLAWRPVIVIDDWGQEANLKAREDWAQAWFFRFLDLRIERGLPLIMTTNLTARDIVERSDNVRGDPLVRRLLEIMDVVPFGPKKK